MLKWPKLFLRLDRMNRNWIVWIVDRESHFSTSPGKIGLNQTEFCTCKVRAWPTNCADLFTAS